MTRVDQSKLLGEYEAVDLGDKRMDQRLRRILPQLAAAPSDSFPEQMESIADREALYRFLSNDKVTLDGLIEGHRQETLKRTSRHSLVRVVHDTSEFTFAGEREGLGALRGDKKGFLGHFALAVVADETREPLGILGLQTFVNGRTDRTLTRSQQVQLTRKTPRDKKRSSRWEALAIEVSESLPSGVEAIHLMDREGADYSIISALRERSLRFVIRGNAARITAENMRTNEVLARQPAKIFRCVPVSTRSKKQAKKKQNPARAQRIAELSVRAATIELVRPSSSPEAALSKISVQAVHVFEASPPPGETAIEWMLFTSEPIDSIKEIEAVVDHYRARWVIEEYFKALKTGCAFEKRQLCSFETLTSALGLFVPVAWTLLALRTLGREATDRPATDIFTENQLRLLRALLERRRNKFVETPTIRDAMLGVAALGGHIKNNGDPGWHVLGRGLRRFIEAQEGWDLAQKM